MADVETGHKWWVRYVVVPLVGGGGAIAILLALLERPDSPVSVQTEPERPEGRARLPSAGKLNVRVDPDTVGIKVEGFYPVKYIFREVGGMDLTVESQDVRWLLTNGTELEVSVGNRVLQGSFTVNAFSESVLVDNVNLPSHIAAAVAGGEQRVQLETTFVAVDAADRETRVKALLSVWPR